MRICYHKTYEDCELTLDLIIYYGREYQYRKREVNSVLKWIRVSGIQYISLRAHFDSFPVKKKTKIKSKHAKVVNSLSNKAK